LVASKRRKARSTRGCTSSRIAKMNNAVKMRSLVTREVWGETGVSQPVKKMRAPLEAQRSKRHLTQITTGASRPQPGLKTRGSTAFPCVSTPRRSAFRNLFCAAYATAAFQNWRSFVDAMRAIRTTCTEFLYNDVRTSARRVRDSPGSASRSGGKRCAGRPAPHHPRYKAFRRARLRNRQA
jgi:hypothetical protein